MFARSKGGRASVRSGRGRCQRAIVAFLYGTVAPGAGRTDGVLAEGTITAANLIGPLAGKSLADLIALLGSRGAYVNVHTNDGVDPINTGPGDFPGGEVRGDIE